MYGNILKGNNSKFPFLARDWEWRGIGSDCPGIRRRRLRQKCMKKKLFNPIPVGQFLSNIGLGGGVDWYLGI